MKNLWLYFVSLLAFSLQITERVFVGNGVCALTFVR